MKYKVERLEMSPRGIMWAIVDENNVRQFPSQNGHGCWVLKREAMVVVRHINIHGVDSVRNKK